MTYIDDSLVASDAIRNNGSSPIDHEVVVENDRVRGQILPDHITQPFLSNAHPKTEKCVHELFEEQVVKTPDVLAVTFESSSLTYRQLNRLANFYATRLRSRGVEPETLVGICAERSLEMVVGLFAILKSGAAYVPIDPSLPAARISYMLSEGNVGVVLLQEKFVNIFDHSPLDKILFLPDSEIDTSRFDTNVKSDVCPENLAYVIYTSGSTGKPKGAMNQHNGIVNRLLWMQDEYKLGQLDRVLQKTPYSFDVSVWEFFWTLMTGATLVMAKPEGHKDPDYLVQVIQQYQITTLHFVPSMLRAFLTSPKVEFCHSVRRVICSGEALTRDLEVTFFSQLSCELHNLYGPTEAAVDVSYWRCEPNNLLPTVPIGRAVANTQLYILDQDLQPVIDDVPGELYIGGIQVGRGYLGRPDLTAEKFIPNPFSDGRLYRTGDRVRWILGGAIEYIGRIDGQVKIRGFRIEIGEIENALRLHPLVEEAVVVPQEDKTGDKTLTAYVIASSLTLREFQRHLLELVPDYMVPSKLVIVDKFPLNANGKIDRNALRLFDDTFVRDLEYNPPKTATQEKIASVWRDVLRLDEISVNENFFDIGGHSLKAGQIISRVNALFGLDVPLREIFNHPTITDLSEIVDGWNHRQSSPIPVTERKQLGTAVQSFAQQGLWLIDQLEPGASTYNIAFAFSITGQFSLDLLNDALSSLIRRHESLRTNFYEADGTPIQVINNPLPVNINVIQASNITEPNEYVNCLLQQYADEPFNINSGQLLRSYLFELSRTEHLLLFVIHHIVFDGWSEDIFKRELGSLYASSLTATSPELPDLKIQYSDYARWQRSSLNVAPHEKYWLEKLKGAPTLHELPTDKPRNYGSRSRGRTVEFTISSDDISKVDKLAQDANATLFMVLVAVLNVLIYRYSGQEDILVGTPSAGRNRPELEGMIGFLVNTIVIRAELNDVTTFLQLVSNIRETTLDALSHAEYPFEKLVELRETKRDVNYNPIFQIMLVLQNYFSSSLDLPGASVTPIRVQRSTSKFDLLFDLTETEQGLTGSIEYNTGLFEHETIERMADHFTTLFSILVSNPQAAFRSVPYLDSSERTKLLEEWNHTKVDIPTCSGVHKQFEELARTNPGSVAIVFEDHILTYSELNERSNLLAHYLLTFGIKQNSLVGMCLERSPALIVGLLAIVKAGATCVSIDSSLPTDRMKFILNDVNPAVVITQESKIDLFRSIENSMLCIDRDWPTIEQNNIKSDPQLQISGSDVAYVVYTSGSTGRPKGTLFTHGGLHNLINWQMRDSLTTSEDRTLQFAPLSFDVSFQEIFSTLSSGGSLVLIDEDAHRDPQLLLSAMRRHQVTRMFVPVVALQQLAEAIDLKQGNLSSVREIITAGEQLRISLEIRSLFAKMPSCVLKNQYGPSESHVVTQHILTSPSSNWPMLPPIGHPIDNSQVYVLDANLEPVPTGVHGELYIAGAQLAQGYLNLPDLTKQRFVSNPFSHDGNDLMYKSGDLVRRLPDGALDFVGRVDHQVKIRGYRIELGEIENALRAHPKIDDAVVVVRDDDRGDKFLVAYVSVEGLDEEQIRSFLTAVLPEYMVPPAFVTLKSLPLNNNGKIDRTALPTPERRDIYKPDYAAPRTDIEKQIVSTWEDLLGLNEIGVYDNFFAIGGQSLKAVRAVSRINRQFDVNLKLRAFYEKPTIADLSSLISIEENSQSKAVEVRKPSQSNVVPQSFAQQQLWLIDQLDPQSVAYHLPYAYRLTGRVDVIALEHALNTILTRHGALRTTFGLIQGVPSQTVSRYQSLVLESINLARPQYTWEMVRKLINEHAAQKFDLSTGPLFRATLFVLDQDESVLLLNFHHIVFDGSSEEILHRELSTLYFGYVTKNTVQLPELAVQYSDYTLWQLESAVPDQQEEYWVNKLADAPQQINLPLDRPRGSSTTANVGTAAVNLTSECTEAVRNLMVDSSTSVYMILLAAWNVLLYRYSGQEDILVGTPVAGRNSPESESLIGYFVNTLVMRTSIAGNGSFLELLGQVRDTTLDALEHKEFPFERLVNRLPTDRSANRNPLFQVSFTFQNTPKLQLQLHDLKVAELEVDGGNAKFDLSLILAEVGDTITGVIEYNSDLFNHSTIERMAQNYTVLLSELVKNPYGSLQSIPYISELEVQQLTAFSAGSHAIQPDSILVHQRFEEIVEQCPSSIAISFGSTSITYDQLNRSANRLARRFELLGVGQGVYVPIIADRSPELITAMIAVLKLGAVYVPLDLTLPGERMQTILSQIELKLIVTDEKHRSQYDFNHVAVFQLDRDWHDIASCPDRNLHSSIDPRDAAYVMFTSGSTGPPKGAVIPHRAIVRLVVNAEYATFGTDEVFLQLAPTAFDASTFEIWGALLNGGRLVIMEPGLAGLHEIAEVIRRNNVTTLWLTSGLFNSFVVSNISGLQGVRQILTGGDVLSVSHVKTSLNALPNTTFINGYGPTENTTFTTCHTIVEDDLARNSIPVGKPISKTCVYVLDNQMRAVALGVIGELYTGGDGVALGYFNDPDATSDKFVPNPFMRGDTLYKTGDRVRWLQSGDLEFVERIDNQIKIRGYRIETAEIENILIGIVNIRDAVVLTSQTLDAEKQLIAYIVPISGIAEFNIAAIRETCQKVMPSYMVPTKFVILQDIPLTTNGKPDRRRLASMNIPQDLPLAANDVSTTAKTLSIVTRIWQQIFRRNHIGIHENFWEIGGNSLTAVRLIAEIENELGRRLPLSIVYAAQTVSSLSKIIDDNAPRSKCSILVPLQQSGEKVPIFCIHQVGGLVGVFRHLAARLGTDHPFWGIQSYGLDQAEQPFTTIETMAAKYMDEIIREFPTGPYNICGSSFGGLVAYEVAQQLMASGRTVNFVGLIDAYPPHEFRWSVQKMPSRNLAEKFNGMISAYLDVKAPNRWMYIWETIKYYWSEVRTKVGKLVPSLPINERIPEPVRAVTDANYEALLNYNPRPYSGEVVFYRAKVHGDREKFNPIVLWSKYVDNLTVHIIPGDHHSMLKPPHVDILAQKILQHVDE